MKHLMRKLLLGMLICTLAFSGALHLCAVAADTDPLMDKIQALDPQDYAGIFQLEGTTDGAYSEMWAYKIAESFAYDSDAFLTALAIWNEQRGHSDIGSFLAYEIKLYHNVGESGHAKSFEDELARQLELAKAKVDIITAIQAEITAQK